MDLRSGRRTRSDQKGSTLEVRKTTIRTSSMGQGLDMRRKVKENLTARALRARVLSPKPKRRAQGTAIWEISAHTWLKERIAK